MTYTYENQFKYASVNGKFNIIKELCSRKLYNNINKDELEHIILLAFHSKNFLIFEYLLNVFFPEKCSNVLYCNFL